MRTLRLGLRCKGWFLVRDNLRKVWRQIWNVLGLGLVVTLQTHVEVTFEM